MPEQPGPDPDITALREEYCAAGLLEGDVDPEPMSMFRRWFDEISAAGLHEPNAMVVATTSPEGQPSARYVLLKGMSSAGFVFFTNTRSHKGEDLRANPHCALLFPWHPLERQVRVEGVADPLPDADVAAYFATRPRGSQLGAWASQQSRSVADREELATAYAEMEHRFDGEDVPVPPEWGGFRVRPELVEFWQGRPGRMHDRLVYTRAGAGWQLGRLAP